MSIFLLVWYQSKPVRGILVLIASAYNQPANPRSVIIAFVARIQGSMLTFYPLAQLDKEFLKCTCPDQKCTIPHLNVLIFRLLTKCTFQQPTHAQVSKCCECGMHVQSLIKHPFLLKLSSVVLCEKHYVLHLIVFPFRTSRTQNWLALTMLILLGHVLGGNVLTVEPCIHKVYK